jgi:Family of unknown function (DUF6298)
MHIPSRAILILLMALALSAYSQAYASGPLRVSQRNPRYFEDAQEQIVYLAGDSEMLTVMDTGPTDPPEPFNFPGYLAFLNRHNLNFIRMWTRENVIDTESGFPAYVRPFPWPRIGPGLALDGKPKFDLAKFDPEYFERLRERVSRAGKQGIYCSIMLFEGWTQQYATKPGRWDCHPFNPKNNVNGIDADPKNTGSGTAYHTLEIPAITALQEAYVRHVVDTVNDLDNVLYEISNEDGPYSKDWQNHFIRFIHDYEKTKPKHHPVGMTEAWMGSEEETARALLESPAEWISPDGNNPRGPWKNDPPTSDGRKVVLVDTDHLWGGSAPPDALLAWVWKTFCRGHNLIFYDHSTALGDNTARAYTGFDRIRDNLGYVRMYSQRMDLAEAVPCDDLASTKYCLSDKRNHVLIFKPAAALSQEVLKPFTAVQVNLTDTSGLFNVEWLDPNTGRILPSGQISAGSPLTLFSPIKDEAVLFLWKPAPSR